MKAMSFSAARMSTTDDAIAAPVCVLVVDDDPTSRMLVSTTLKGHTGSIVEAENGLVAVQALDRQVFDLAIVDLDMPVMDGFGVIERARARAETRHLPIVVVTGRDDVVAIERAFALGATSFLCKPINWNVFRHQVGYVLQVARVERETRAAKERAERLALLQERGLAALKKEIGSAVNSIAAFSPAVAAPPEARSLTAIVAAGARLQAAAARVDRASHILTGAARYEPEAVMAKDIAVEAMQKVREELGSGAAERIELCADEDLRLVCDRALAVEGLRAVLENALTFSAPDRRVRLAAISAPPDRVRFEIEDHGAGIPEDMLQGGFESAQPGEGARRTGLGLAVARAVVERHGGHFGIMSELGSGTEIFMSFPSNPSGDGEAAPNRIDQISPIILPKAASVSAS